MNELFSEPTRPTLSTKTNMAASSQRISSRRFSAKQALLLLVQWNAASDSESCSSSTTGKVSESSGSDGDTATAQVCRTLDARNSLIADTASSSTGPLCCIFKKIIIS